jgi:hypothetical protein
MTSKPKDKSKYVEVFKSADSKKTLDALFEKIKTASPKYAADFQYRLTQKRVPREDWKGRWDMKLEAYTPRKPDSHAAAWWRELEIEPHNVLVSKSKASEVADKIPGRRYCDAFASSETKQDLIQKLWFVGTDGPSVRAVIEACHDLLNEWCDRNNKERVRMLKDRQNYLSEAEAGLFVAKNEKDLGGYKFILEKNK